MAAKLINAFNVYVDEHDCRIVVKRRVFYRTFSILRHTLTWGQLVVHAALIQ